MKNLAAVVLAAGLSSRFGARDKLLHPYRGRLLLEWTLRAVAAAGLVDCVVVIGPQEAEKAALVAAHGLRAIENPTPELGMAVSLGCGVRGVRGKIDGIFICLGDMPAVTSAHLRQLAARFEALANDAILAPTHQQQRGHPVLFGAAHRAALSTLEGDHGARALLATAGARLVLHDLQDAAVLRDIDTVADLN